jgi:hypothetical protein
MQWIRMSSLHSLTSFRIQWRQEVSAAGGSPTNKNVINGSSFQSITIQSLRRLPRRR